MFMKSFRWIKRLKAPSPTFFYVFHFNLSYYFCLSSFHFTKTKTDKTYRLSTWWPQKFMCALAYLLVIPYYIRGFRGSIPDNPKNPSQYFSLVLNLTYLGMLALLIKQVWFDSLHFINIINFLEEKFESILSHSRNVSLLRNSRLVFVASFCINIANGLVHGLVNIKWMEGAAFTNNGDLFWWFRPMVVAGKLNFFINGKSPSNESTFTDLQFSVGDYMMGIVSFIGYIYWYILTPFCFHHVTAGLVTLWVVVCSFVHTLGNNTTTNEVTLKEKIPMRPWVNQITIYVEDDRTITHVLREFETLKRLTKLVNQSVENICTVFLVKIMFYYSTRSRDIFSWESLIPYLLYLFSLEFVIPLAAADICYQMREFQLWISNHKIRLQLPSGVAENIIVQMNDNAVSIKASGVFTITYELVASIIGSTVTFFIICVQN